MRNIRILKSMAMIAAAVLVCGCGKEEVKEEKNLPVMSLKSKNGFNFKASSPGPQTLTFRTNCEWTIEVPSDAAWVKVEPRSGKPVEEFEDFDVSISVTPPEDGKEKTATLAIRYGNLSKKVTVTYTALSPCSQFEITDDMLFSTTLGKNSTNVPQGFDYDPDEDIIYITQKYGTYRNHIGWQKRETAFSTATAADYMTLSCFSHGNNIAIEKTKSGAKYVWAPNYGTRQDDGSYDKPHVVSRFPLESKKTILNTDTVENYYFGLSTTWPAFDFDEDLMAVCDYKKFYIYRISELQALPVEDVKLDFTITYGGSTPVDTKRAEWTGVPVIKARDCRKVKPLYTVTFDYGNRGLHWQSYCIDNGWIYAILQADTKSAPEIIFDTYVEAYKMDGSKNVYKIRQEYMQNRDAILKYDCNEKDYFYCEPEGIKVMGDTMLMMYALRGQATNHAIRRPVIFKVATPVM